MVDTEESPFYRSSLNLPLKSQYTNLNAFLCNHSIFIVKGSSVINLQSWTKYLAKPKKPSKIEQDFKDLLSNFASFLAAIVKV